MRSVIAIAAVLTASAAISAPAQAQQWCGFKEKPNAVIRCGFSSYEECHAAVGKKNADCVPDPDFASRTRRHAAVRTAHR